MNASGKEVRDGNRPPVRLLLEGPPRVGKTTAITQVVDLLRARAATVAGIVTREIRSCGERVGFEVADLAGTRAVLAHINLPTGPRIGRYRVDVASFEKLSVPAIQAMPPDAIVVIDELGPMELLSAAFVGAVDDLLDKPLSLVATVQSGRHHVTDRWKSRPGVELVTVTIRNRHQLPDQILARLAPSMP